MKGIAIAFVFLLPLIVGYVLGRMHTRRQGLDGKEQKELEALRDLKHVLLRTVGEHKALGDGYAFVVDDQLTTFHNKKGYNK